MVNIIIVLAILALFFVSIRKSFHHLKGEDDCCGGCGGSCCHCNSLKNNPKSTKQEKQQ